MPKANPYRNLSIAILVITSLIWGSSFILMKKATQVFTPVEVGTLRIFIAFMAFLPIFWWERRKIDFKGRFGLIFLSGMMGSFLPSLLFSWAGTRIASSLSGMLNATTPLFTVLIGLIFYQQQVAGIRWLGLFLGLAGSLVLGFLKPGGQVEMNIFVLPVVFATLCYALNVNLLKKRFEDVHPLVLSASTIVAVGPLAGVILFGTTPFLTHLRQEPGALQALSYVALLGIFGTAVALVLFNKLIQISSPLTASSVTYMMPVVSVLWGLADAEPFGLVQVAGLLALLLGVYLVNRKGKESS
jgi:drug/metabolite transporter (DMT)-like permease